MRAQTTVHTTTFYTNKYAKINGGPGGKRSCTITTMRVVFKSQNKLGQNALWMIYRPLGRRRRRCPRFFGRHAVENFIERYTRTYCAAIIDGSGSRVSKSIDPSEDLFVALSLDEIPS